MKFFHLADLHIGIKLLNNDLGEDQEYVFRQIADAAALEQPDAVVIAGDIYDKPVPSAEAVELFDRFLVSLNTAAPDAEIMMISGNHDSGARINLFRSILAREKVHMIGLPPQSEDEHIEKVTLNDRFGAVNFYLLPFVKPSMARSIVGSDTDGSQLTYDETLRRLISREEINEDERNVLVSHQFYLPKGQDASTVERMDSEIRTVGNIDQVFTDMLAPFDYVALGHIHKPMSVGSDRIRYCGTPLAVSVSEAGQRKGITVVELLEKGTVQTHVIPLIPRHEVRVLTGTLDEVLLSACDDYVSVVLTDTVDLDVIDMQDRLRHAFPNLLEIRRQTYAQTSREDISSDQELPGPFELCCAFLKDTDEEEQALLQDVINTVLGGEQS